MTTIIEVKPKTKIIFPNDPDLEGGEVMRVKMHKGSNAYVDVLFTPDSPTATEVRGITLFRKTEVEIVNA